jgi:hypothetical protein
MQQVRLHSTFITRGEGIQRRSNLKDAMGIQLLGVEGHVMACCCSSEECHGNNRLYWRLGWPDGLIH